MKKIFLSDLTIGLFLTLLTLGAFFWQTGFLESLELKTYDWRCLLRQSSHPGDEVAIVAIDDDSIAKIGRWPWPRSYIADGINVISQSGARVIGLNILFTEAERNQGLLEIRSLKDTLPQLFTGGAKAQMDAAMEKVYAELSAAELRLDNDSRLLESLQFAKNVTLPMYFTPGAALGQEEAVLASQTLTKVSSNGATAKAIEGHKPAVPLDVFTAQASAVGHVNSAADPDGAVRAEVPVIQFRGDFYPSFALQLVRQYLNVPLEEVKLNVGSSLVLGKAVIPLDSSNRMQISYNGPVGTFRYYSFYDVLNQKVDANAFKDRIVIVGTMATGLAPLNVTPLGGSFPSDEIIANVVQNILHANYITRPAWADKAEMACLLIIGLFIAFGLPRLKALSGAIVSGALFLAVTGAATYVFIAQGWWIKIFYALFLLTAGYIVITSKRFLVVEKKKEVVEAGAIETNKMLGLSFQSQGMLDMAFEKFRKCPIDDQMKELLYNLGLDFERKRQHNKAAAVYEHIASEDKGYKDIRDKITQLKAAAEGMIFGTTLTRKATTTDGGTMLLDGANATHPVLGRYEIVKELGRGAMGTVYLGRDPKINRQVAIKTLRFDDDIDEASVKTVKERFFREAESAGNLNHPNIIKIFDAGEDNEMSYIAMELLEGEDLKKSADKLNLLPIRTLVSYMIKVADGLDYAHQQGVIHRDIKPANIMILRDGTLRITDFGIARIATSSKTQTGTVLGTPSYMSPEQLAGKKVDGRSDLFSFGVMFYELLTGCKPFEGESIAELLFKIANEKQADPRQHNGSIPASVVAVIDKLLAKQPEERYQRGKDISADLLLCLKEIEAQSTLSVDKTQESKQPDMPA